MGKMKPVTNEDWKSIEHTVVKLGLPVKMEADGYSITLAKVAISDFNTAILVYVNGKFNAKWVITETEERRRFCQKKERHSLSKKTRDLMKKNVNKLPRETRLDYEKRIDTKYVEYNPFWKSFGALKKHLIENNKELFVEV